MTHYRINREILGSSIVKSRRIYGRDVQKRSSRSSLTHNKPERLSYMESSSIFALVHEYKERWKNLLLASKIRDGCRGSTRWHTTLNRNANPEPGKMRGPAREIFSSSHEYYSTTMSRGFRGPECLLGCGATDHRSTSSIQCNRTASMEGTPNIYDLTYTTTDALSATYTCRPRRVRVLCHKS